MKILKTTSGISAVDGQVGTRPEWTACLHVHSCGPRRPA